MSRRPALAPLATALRTPRSVRAGGLAVLAVAAWLLPYQPVSYTHLTLPTILRV